MANGFDIHVSEFDFKSKPAAEQAWLTFKAVEGAILCIKNIEEKGCSFSRGKYLMEKKVGIKQALILFGSSVGVGIPVGIAIYTMICR